MTDSFILYRNQERVCDFCLSSLTERRRVYLPPTTYWLCDACAPPEDLRPRPTPWQREVAAVRVRQQAAAARKVARMMDWLTY